MSTWHDQQAINNSNYNVKVKHRFRRRSSVEEFDTGKMQQRLEPSLIAHENMLGAGLMMQRFEDDMKRTWNEQMNKIQHALKLKEGKTEKTGLIWLGGFTPCPLELHNTSHKHHHWNPCMILPQNHIRHGTI